MKNSWVKLYRSLVDDAVFDDAEILKVWIWILCKVVYKPETRVYKKQVVELEPGQMIISRKDAAEILKISERKFRDAIEILDKIGCISKKTTNRFTLINVIKWGFFQGQSEDFDQQTTNKRPTDDQQTTNRRPAYNKKKYKNINKYNNYNNAHARESECVPTPKATKFNNFTPSGDIDYAELEKRALQKQLERTKENEQIQEQKI